MSPNLTPRESYLLDRIEYYIKNLVTEIGAPKNYSANEKIKFIQTVTRTNLQLIRDKLNTI